MSILINGLRGLPKYKSLKQDHILPCYISIHEDDTAELNIAGMAFPLSKVPTPHGTLIDKEVAIETFKEVYCGHCKKEIPCFVCSVPIALDVLNDIPTIIEAEVSEE